MNKIIIKRGCVLFGWLLRGGGVAFCLFGVGGFLFCVGFLFVCLFGEGGGVVLLLYTVTVLHCNCYD